MIDPDALYVVQTLQNSGFPESYLVGGCIRDLLFGGEPKDWDISTSAKPEEIAAIFQRKCRLIGRRFRLAHIRFGKKILEVSTFRKGDTESSSLVVNDNEYGSQEEDAKRRDFTINALFYDPSNETIIDHVNGFPDVQKRYLEVIGTSQKRFMQDPVRMLRLLKFMARFDLDVDPEALVSLKKQQKEILKASSARVLEEILRMLESSHAADFFTVMHKYGMLKIMLPKLDEFLFSGDARKEVFQYLKKMDQLQKERKQLGKRSLSRPVLLAAIFFPFMERAIKTKYTDNEEVPHLEHIQTTARETVRALTNSFIQLSKNDFCHTVSVIKNQFRFVPLCGVKKRRPRISKEPGFNHALKFLLIRAELSCELMPIWEEWNEAFQKHRKQHGPPPSKKRRRRPPRKKK